MEIPDSATAVLLSTPEVGHSNRAACTDLLTAGAAHPPNVLHVDFVRRPEDRIRQWQRSDTSPAELAILHVDTEPRSAGSDDVEADSRVPSPVVETVRNPGDLTGLGIAFTKQIERWEDSDSPVRLCFHSISTLLHYADVSPVFRFLNTVRGQLSRADAVGHFHVQPGAHDDRTLAKLHPLFDAVVAVDLEGEVDVRVA